jgi:hypothetical protein
LWLLEHKAEEELLLELSAAALWFRFSRAFSLAN